MPAVGMRVSVPVAAAALAAAAAGALGRIASPPACAALEKAFAGAPADRLPALAAGLLAAADASIGAGRAKEAADLFVRVAASGVPPHLKTAGRLGLIRARGDAGAGELELLLRSDDPTLYAAALGALHTVPGAALTRAAAEVVGAIAPERRALLIEALGDRRDASALPALLAAAKAGPDECRTAAIASLVRLGSAEGLPVLMELATTAGGAVAKSAETALASYPGPAVETHVIRMAEAPDPASQVLALQLIAQRRIASAVPVAVKSAKSAQGAVRTCAIRALREIGGAGELGLLIELTVRPPAPEDQRNAEAALTAVASRQADPGVAAAALSAAIGTTEGEGRLALLRTLCAVGGPAALEAVRKAAAHPDAAFKAAAQRAICDWRSADALPDVTALARSADDPTLKILALRGYIRLAGLLDAPAAKKVETLQDAMNLATRDDERKLVLGALGQIEDGAALTAVVPHLANAALKEEAGQAAVAIAEKLADKNPAAVVDAMKAVLAGGDGPLAQKARALQAKAAKAMPKN